MPEPGELRRPVAPVVDRQPEVGHEVDDEDEERAERRGLREELQRVGAPAPGEHEQQRETEEDAPDHNRRTAGRMHATDCGGQQSLPVGVEHHPGLGVHAGDQYAQRRGQPGQVGEEGERVQGVVGDADEGISVLPRDSTFWPNPSTVT